MSLRDKLRRPKFSKRHLVWSVSIFAVLYCTVLSDNSLLQLVRLWWENRDLAQEIKSYEEQYTRDSINLHRLEKSQAALERVARIDLLMKRDNEDIYVVSEEP